MKLRWFLSATVRDGLELFKHVRKLRNAQRDILAPQALEALDRALGEMKAAIDSNVPKQTVKDKMTELETAANKWLKPYPNAAWRENIEVLLVAIAVAMAIRTFFLQPFKIPTGSMQPTLYGVTSENLMNRTDVQVPGMLKRIFDACYYGRFYHEAIAKADGEIVGIGRSRGFGINLQTVAVRYQGESQPTSITIWFAPDDRLEDRAGIMVGTTFRKGEPIVRFVEKTGDHLFVDRVTYNFRHPDRGEIVVFKTAGIPGLPQNQFYIKRLVGLPGEEITIGKDRHVRINGRRLDASTPHFEKIYGFNPKEPPQESHYSGHVPAASYYMGHESALFDSNQYRIGDGRFMVFGDNTMNSLDSRYWGDFPEQNVIGKSFFVYWPVSDRFGWGQQ